MFLFNYIGNICFSNDERQCLDHKYPYSKHVFLHFKITYVGKKNVRSMRFDLFLYNGTPLRLV